MASLVTFGHDLVHGDREEEDGVAVVGPGASAEVLLHGLHDGEELVCQHGHIMEDDLWDMRRPQSAIASLSPPGRQQQTGRSQEDAGSDGDKGSGEGH